MMHDCPDAMMRDLLPDFVHETLPARDHERVAAHVASCTDCAAEVALIRSALASVVAGTPKMDVARIIASLPSPSDRVGTGGVRLSSSASGAGGGMRFSRWRIAAMISVVALGGLSVAVLRGTFDTAGGGGPESVAAAPRSGRPAADASREAHKVPVTRGREAGAANREDELVFGGGLSDLSDDQLKLLLQDLDALDVSPSAEPENHVTPIVPVRGGGNNAQ